MKGDLRFRFPDGLIDDSLRSIVADSYALKAEKPVDTTVNFYDTFDWRLFKKSLVLCRIGDELIVRGLPTGADLERLTSASPPSFVGEIADSPLKRRIASIVGVRRLLQVGEATIQTAPYRVLNADSKTVARLLETRVHAGPFDGRKKARGASPAQLDAYVVLQRVRGYPGHFRRLARKMADAGLTVCRWQATFERILAAFDRRPGDYAAKPDYQIAPGTRADEAAKEILRCTLAVMRANEGGIKADLDTEFLHDYRTALRRTRSALSLIPDVFPPEITAHYKEAFARFGQRTNLLRDLDVYLLAEPDYRAMLPDALRTSIDPLFDHLRAQRRQALKEVIDNLESMPYASMMEAWAAFLHAPVPNTPVASNALLPIDAVARRQIRKRFRRVIKDGKRTLAHARDEVVHALRIDCKKLRYSMEFFASLFPKKEFDQLIRQLKTLQDDLGVFNDLSVQQAYLLQMAEVLPAGDARGKKALVAIGFLVEKLADEQQAMKPRLAQTFTEFATARNRKMFRQLVRN